MKTSKLFSPTINYQNYEQYRTPASCNSVTTFALKLLRNFQHRTAPSLMISPKYHLQQVLDSWIQDPEATGQKEEAARRILEAFEVSKKTTSSVSLDLSNLELNIIPDCLRFFPHSIGLNLENNRITNFSIPRGSLNNLDYLNLRNNNIRYFSIPRESLNNLLSLNLSNNQITDFTIPSDCLNNLQELNLSNNQIMDCNFPCDSLNNLQKLDLSENQISNFPILRGSLNNLQELYLSHNEIENFSIPRDSLNNLECNETPEIATQNVQRALLVKILEEWVHDTTATGNKTEATNLILDCFDSKKTDLKLFYLNINKLPDCLRFLSHIEKLNLSNNQITDFPIPSNSLNNLQELDLSNNKITNFPIPSDSLNNLQHLDLSRNNISDFPIPSDSFNNLRGGLNLSHNKISNFPIPSNSLNNLRGLDLSFNQITNFPIPRGSLNNLEELRLSYNTISDFPIPRDSLNNLQELRLSSNKFSNFPISRDSLNKLEELDLSMNEITNFPIPRGSLNNLLYLNLSHNKISDVPIPSDTFNNLIKLNLFNNKITDFTIPSDSLHNIQRLVLSHNTPLRTISMTSPLILLDGLSVANNPNLHELPLLLGRSQRLTHIDTDFSAPQLRRSAAAILEATHLLRNSTSGENLPAELTLWKRYAGNQEMDTTRILNALTPDNQGTVYEWLVRLSQSADFKRNQRKLASVVCHILKDLTNKDFRDLALSQMAANNEACQDRASMALNELYLSWALLCSSSNIPPKERLTMIAKAGRTLALREAIANQLAGRPDIAESVETYLYYETHLADSLGLLTCIKSMSYPRCAKPLDEQKLRDYVEEHYLEKAADIPLLEKMMTKDSSLWVKLLRIKNEALKELNELSENEPTNDSGLSPERWAMSPAMLNWQAAQAEIGNKRDSAITALKIEWLKKQIRKNS